MRIGFFPCGFRIIFLLLVLLPFSMNPSSAPYLNHYFFPYPPQNPNPNFFFPSVPEPPLPPPPQPQPPPPPQIPPATATPVLDLSTTLSSLTDLLSLSHQTLSCLSSLFSHTTSPKPQNANYVSCSYNPHHLMPPESLFLHSLRCPSSLVEDPTFLIDSLHYPKTVKLQNPFKSLFTQSFQDSSTELCFSLDGYYNEFDSNFFYKDCPGVVNSNHLDISNKTFTLPGVLSVECANFVGSSEGDINGFDKNEFRILPSDLWAIKREVEGWVDYPRMYSYGVFSAILQLNVITCSDLRRWVIGSSPRYGVVIDVYMRDHLSVLFSLCLKAIRREAFSLMGHGMHMKTFNCPVLGQVLMWIASQLSVLYGEVNAKCFAIHIFRQCVLEVANGVFFPWESNLKEGSTELDANGNDVRDLKFKEPLEGSTVCKVSTEVDESVDEKVILVSQVAASVAALHERSLLEAKLKRLRVSQPVPRYQRMAEHDYISKRADEERKKRSDYRAIIEHDGLPLKQSSNQETSKTKTREELLAEERDYKRRRMSYRGKKLKRTTLQVMRDIIDEYMEEIKQAGGIGCFEKGAEEKGMTPKAPFTSFTSDLTMDVDELRKSNSKSSESIRAATNHYQKQSHLNHNSKSKDASPRDYERQGHDYHRHCEHIDYQRNTSQDRHSSRDYYSGSPERHRSHGLLHEPSSHHDLEFTITKHQNYRSSSKTSYQRSSSKTSYQNYKSSHSISDPANNSSVQKDGEKLDVRDRHLRNTYGNRSSKFLAKKEFEDRYDPSESRDTYEDGVYTVHKYVRPEEFHE